MQLAGQMNEPQGLFDIYEQFHVPFWQTTLFYAICAILFCVMLGVLVYGIYIYFRSKKIALSPWDQALLELGQLQRDNKVKASEGKYFYGSLTSILKKYVHQRYFDKQMNNGMVMDGLAYTDEEFLQELHKKDFNPELTEKLQEIFMGSLVIKFANMQAIQEQMERDFMLATIFVKQTQPSKKK